MYSTPLIAMKEKGWQDMKKVDWKILFCRYIFTSSIMMCFFLSISYVESMAEQREYYKSEKNSCQGCVYDIRESDIPEIVGESLKESGDEKHYIRKYKEEGDSLNCIIIGNDEAFW